MGAMFETAMIICFGISWPISVRKSWISRTTKGKSLFFEIFIWMGYLLGIMGKIISHNVTYVILFYVLNLFMVTVDLCLYYRNYKIDCSGKDVVEN